jgi:hypothetical protein
MLASLLAEATMVVAGPGRRRLARRGADIACLVVFAQTRIPIAEQVLLLNGVPIPNVRLVRQRTAEQVACFVCVRV